MGEALIGHCAWDLLCKENNMETEFSNWDTIYWTLFKFNFATLSVSANQLSFYPTVPLLEPLILLAIFRKSTCSCSQFLEPLVMGHCLSCSRFSAPRNRNDNGNQLLRRVINGQVSLRIVIGFLTCWCRMRKHWNS